MENRPSFNENEGTGKPNLEWPVPVPKHLRTKRALPRLFAATVIVISVLTFYLGIAKLSEREMQPDSAIDQLLQVGTADWGANLKTSPDTCVGYVKSVLTADKEPSYHLQGAFRLRMYQDPILVNLSLEAQFSTYRQLQVIHAHADLGTSSITIDTDPLEEKKLNIVVQAGGLNRQFVVDRPDPIFLVERFKDNYSLHMPEHLIALLQGNPVGAPGISPVNAGEARPLLTRSLAFSELKPDKAGDCRAQVLDLSSGIQEDMYDVGPIFQLLQIKEKAPRGSRAQIGVNQ